MALTVKGVYKAGRVELLERPVGVAEGTEVVVTFINVGTTEESVAPEPSREEARREAGRRLIAILEKGIPFGGAPYPKREELYDRVYRFDQNEG